jgi:hypothetical protein
MICPICKTENEDDWPLEIDGKMAHGGCQNCWEEQCNKEWWREMQRTEKKPHKQNPLDICKWTLEIDNDDCRFWRTDCNEAHVFITGGPKGNKYKYCPYCSGQIEEYTLCRFERC